MTQPCTADRNGGAGSLSPSRGRRNLQLWSRVLLAPYLVTLLLVTLLPGSEAARVTGIVKTVATWLDALGLPYDVAYPLMEFLANIALFVPFGLLIAVAWPAAPHWRIVAAGFATSGAIELVQLILPTRFSTLSDLIANTLGTVIGCAVAVLFAGFLRHRRRTLEP
ncbi:putative VanZ-like family protein [Microbacterium sp. HM58-2]|nr:putative VanZ-like family protein [Microbacterium sp. HM58-2]